ncbi:MAG: acyl-CoA carboxylase subunit epsilon [Bifidobacteriaceae bacterium]|jgi:hypothetical protein|nr:acyl-CoA carboxylase subunit epsilon [Bifidobacteriaceae bacterium]
MNPPAVIVAKGEPSEAELVALVAALTALTASTADAVTSPATERSAWSDRCRLLHAAPSASPGAWRRSYLPG